MLLNIALVDATATKVIYDDLGNAVITLSPTYTSTKFSAEKAGRCMQQLVKLRDAGHITLTESFVSSMITEDVTSTISGQTITLTYLPANVAAINVRVGNIPVPQSLISLSARVVTLDSSIDLTAGDVEVTYTII